MTKISQPTHTRSVSTTYANEDAKIRRPAARQSTARRRRSAEPGRYHHRWYHRPRLAWGTRVTIKVQLVGGATGRMRVAARGAWSTYDAHTALIDVLADVLNQSERPER